ncbi:LIM domain-containing protein [Ditylenchus destructor]|nr:LIM domain-containing protein [Ditylenchus destructor]
MEPLPKSVCCRCNSAVVPAERLIINNFVFHKLCFLCSNPSCHCALDGNNCGQKNGKIYCKHCLDAKCLSSREPSPERTVNEISTVNETTTGEQNSCHLLHCLSSTSLAEFLMANSTQVSFTVSPTTCGTNTPNRESMEAMSNSYFSPRSVKENLLHKKLSPRKFHSFLSTNDLDETMNSSMGNSIYSEPVRRSSGSYLNLPVARLICQRCDRTVYEAEKMKAAGKVWHKSCFRCLSCRHPLALGKFCSEKGELFCSTCYSKYFGPKGLKPFSNHAGMSGQ